MKTLLLLSLALALAPIKGHATYLMNNSPLGNSQTSGYPQEQIRIAESSGFNQTEIVRYEDTTAEPTGYTALNSSWGGANWAPIWIIPRQNLAQGAPWGFQDAAKNNFRLFVETLRDEKTVLMEYFGLSNADYNRIALMSLGILGNESQFYTSARYWLKQSLPDVIINVLKGDPNALRSRGGTQIKVMPQAVKNLRNALLSNSDLNRADISALATFVFIVVARDDVKRLAQNSSHFKTYFRNRSLELFDYVPYIYIGSGYKVRNRFNMAIDTDFSIMSESLKEDVALPYTNAYVKNLRTNMAKFILFEAKYLEVRNGITRQLN